MSNPSVAVSDNDIAGSLDVIRRALSEQAGVSSDRIDIDKPMSAIPGIESVKALRAITQIEDDCEVVIPDDFLFESSTVREFAGFLAGLVRQKAAEETL